MSWRTGERKPHAEVAGGGPGGTRHQGLGRNDLGLAGLISLAMAVLVTWPQALSLSGTFAAHVDSYFSTWRLMWIAHALKTDPRHLFDTNIFYPSTGTLAYSDATLLQGLIATPFLWAGVSPILMYNLLLLAGYVGSGVAMFVLVRYLTGQRGAALVAAAVFTLAPYRTEHFMHLEMQWAMWIPLAFWALHRAVDAGDGAGARRWGALSGLFIGLQVLSCVYYGVFLALTLLVFVPVLLAFHLLRGQLDTPDPSRTRSVSSEPADKRTALVSISIALAAGAIVAAAIAVPYALPYMANAKSLGDRAVEDVLELSATPLNYLASPGPNLWWGWTSEIWGQNERRLFPGLLAIVLALAAFTARDRRQTWIYAIVAALSVELSFGLHGWLYSWLATHVQALHGLRSPARFAIVLQAAVAVLAGLGVAGLRDRLVRRDAHQTAQWLTSAIVLLMAVESINRPLPLDAVSPPDPKAHDVYRTIRSQGPGVILELPVPRLDRLPGFDAMYAFASAAHWYKLVNGYSGYYPQVYAETLNVMANFPDAESIARLQRLDVRYLVVHRELYTPEAYTALLVALGQDSRFKPLGTFRPEQASGADRERKESTLFVLDTAAR